MSKQVRDRHPGTETALLQTAHAAAAAFFLSAVLLAASSLPSRCISCAEGMALASLAALVSILHGIEYLRKMKLANSAKSTSCDPS